MRKTLLLFIFSVSISCFSQNREILYNFTSVPQSLLSNPGSDVKYNWFIGVPLLSGISANVGSSGFSAYDLFANNGVDFNTKLRNVVFSSSRNDKLVINEQVELFSGGFKIGDWQKSAYISSGMYQELDVLTYMPKDPAILALDGNKDYLGKVFNFGDLSMKGEMLSVFHVGYHKNISDKLIIGVRGKIYSSVFNVSSTQNSGYFYTIPSTNSIYEQVINSNILVNTSGFLNYTRNYTGNAKSDITKKTLFGGNLGLGFDAGLTYYFQKNIQFTASIIDVGFIKHAKDIENYSLKGTYNYMGLTPDFLSGSSTNIYQAFKKAIPLDTLHNKYTTWRPVKFNSSVQYSFGDGRNSECSCSGNEMKYKNSVGAQLFAMTTPRMPLMALTAYYRRQIFESLEMKATYTVDSFSVKNIGLGLSTTIGKVNFYMMADNLLEFRDVSKANSMSFQLGLNVFFPDKNTPD
ncbi:MULTISPECIES: DUF5723 family protein [unclassified Flavobacterium]|jgi:hypothetical protein|uniref:DUF5723 family protein n=1 Tax=unclassified Flavobacterium TaxID=196869 RepID=UPI0025C25CEC|nr:MULTISPECIES: DUF5723 family protein [unclassified Flavobacterium]